MRYHLFVLSVGQNSVERVYVPDTGQTREEAEATLKRTQKSRVIGYKFCRPTSDHAAEITEREARQPSDAPLDGKKRRVVYRSKTSG